MFYANRYKNFLGILLALISLSLFPNTILAADAADKTENSAASASANPKVQVNFAPAAADKLREITDEALVIFRTKPLSDAQKKVKLRELMLNNVEVNSVIRFLFGRAIKSATPEQKAELTKLISEFIVNSYTVNLANYGNLKVNISDARMDGPSALVFTEILKPKNSGSYQIIWRLVMHENQPKLVDCIVEGISINVTQKQEFASIMERSGKGIDGVIDALRVRLSNMN